MKNAKRLVASLTAAALTLSASAAALPVVSAVTAEDVTDIVVLGDSISTGYGLEDLEAIAGTDIYAYTDYLSDYLDATVTNYAVNGQRSEELLTAVKGYDAASAEYASLANSDMICVTIGGNDLLQPTKEYFESYVNTYNTINGTNYTAKEVLKAVGGDSDAVKKLAMGLTSALSDALKYVIGFEDITDIDGNVTEEGYIGYIAELEQTLRAMNSDAEIVFQTVYNPVSVPSNIAVDEDYAYALSQLRLMGESHIGKVNTAINKLAEENDISVADVKTAFANPDFSLSTEWVYMIHGDNLNALDVHPNRIGHAVIAAEVLEAVEADGSACTEFNTALRSAKTELISANVYESTISAMGSYVTAEEPTVTLTIDPISASAGETISVPVQISGCDAVSGLNLSFTIPAGLTCEAITTEGNFSDAVVSPADGTFVWAEATGADIDCTDAVTLFTMNLTTPADLTEATEYTIAISAAEAVDSFGNNITVSTTDGTISVIPAPAYRYENHTIEIGTVTGMPGDTVKVPVTVYNDPGTAGFSLDFDIDSSLTFYRRGAGDAYEGSPTWNPTLFRYIWWASDGRNRVAETGAVITYLVFTIPEDAYNGFYPIAFVEGENELGNKACEMVNENGQPLQPDYVAGGIQIVGGQDHSILKGDANMDGVVNTNDAVLILKENAAAIIGKDSLLDANQTIAADVDENGIVDSDDAAYVLKYYAQSIIGTPDWDTILPAN